LIGFFLSRNLKSTKPADKLDGHDLKVKEGVETDE
jgi:hypothetical protein